MNKIKRFFLSKEARLRLENKLNHTPLMSSKFLYPPVHPVVAPPRREDVDLGSGKRTTRVKSSKSRRWRKLLSLVLSVLLVFISVRFVFFSPKEAVASWYNDIWSYREKIT